MPLEQPHILKKLQRISGSQVPVLTGVIDPSIYTGPETKVLLYPQVKGNSVGIKTLKLRTYLITYSSNPVPYQNCTEL